MLRAMHDIHDTPIFEPADASLADRARPIPARRTGWRTGERPEAHPASVRVTAVDRPDGIASLRVDGVLDGHTYGAFLDALAALLDRGSTRVVLDLAAVVHLSSAGAAACVAAAGAAEAAGGAVAMCAPPGRVHRLLTTLGIDAVAPCFPETDAAARWLAGE